MDWNSIKFHYVYNKLKYRYLDAFNNYVTAKGLDSFSQLWLKQKKERAKKYDEKLAVQNITFDELIQLSANYTPPKKPAVKKPAKKKK
jgi:hypothetical protein